MRAKFHTIAMEAKASFQEVCYSYIRNELCKIDIWELKLRAKGHDIWYVGDETPHQEAWYIRCMGAETPCQEAWYMIEADLYAKKPDTWDKTDHSTKRPDKYKIKLIVVPRSLIYEIMLITMPRGLINIW